jgi:hypothetical protein
MAIEIGKLYLVEDISTATNQRPVLLELAGATVDIMIYGSQDESLTQADLVPQLTENLTEAMGYTLSNMPKYVAFVGTVTKINVEGRKLVEIGDLV